MTKPSVFRDEQLQKEFNENGFVKFRMFNAEQMQRLRDFYLATQPDHETVIDRRKFHTTNDTDNAVLIGDADSLIKQVMFEELDKHFKDYKTIEGTYLLKQPHEDSELGPHQDLSFVDESKYYSFNIWVATEATNRHNGGLRFLKGSHLLHDTIRAMPAYPWKYQEVRHLIPQYFTDITTEVGECVVLNHACIHASYPNLSGQTRIAAILGMIPHEAEICHYFLPEGNPQNQVEKYSMTLEDFIHLKENHRPEGAKLEQKFHYDFSPMDKASFLTWIKNSPNNQLKKNGFFRNILSPFFKNT